MRTLESRYNRRYRNRNAVIWGSLSILAVIGVIIAFILLVGAHWYAVKKFNERCAAHGGVVNTNSSLRSYVTYDSKNRPYVATTTDTTYYCLGTNQVYEIMGPM